jgi:hypothetical protein
MRSSQRDHLWSFKNYSSGHSCFYLNLAFGGFPSYLKFVNFDLIIFDWTFVGTRVDRAHFKKTIKLISRLKEINAVKVCLPQDEFTSMDILCDFINDFNIRYVFSVAPPSEWIKIYKTVDARRVRFIQVLTGYLDEVVVNKWSDLSRNSAEKRPLDIGYRTISTAIWGRFNLLKTRIADVFQKEAVTRELNTDIKVGAEHFKMGDEWLRFLLDCRYTLGVEGGSHILDWDGSIHASVTELLKQTPNTTYDDLTLTCVPAEREGEINVVAISPRHLEACLTRTVQILVEGEYNGILKPNEHYIPLKADFSNLADVFERISDESGRIRIAEAAFQDIVASGKYTYRSMVQTVLDEAIGSNQSRMSDGVTNYVLRPYNRLTVYINIVFVYSYSRIRELRSLLIKSLLGVSG